MSRGMSAATLVSTSEGLYENLMTRICIPRPGPRSPNPEARNPNPESRNPKPESQDYVAGHVSGHVGEHLGGALRELFRGGGSTSRGPLFRGTSYPLIPQTIFCFITLKAGLSDTKVSSLQYKLSSEPPHPPNPCGANMAHVRQSLRPDFGNSKPLPQAPLTLSPSHSLTVSLSISPPQVRAKSKPVFVIELKYHESGTLTVEPSPAEVIPPYPYLRCYPSTPI